MDGTVSTVANSAQDIVETVLHVITLMVSVMGAVMLDGQGLPVTKVNKLIEI